MGIHRDWLTRSWSFDFPPDLYPEVIERLRGTPLRLEAAVAGLDPPSLTRRLAYDWSIQENVGHIGDMDELFNGRIDDFLSNAEVLRPADMSNQATNDAKHNAPPIEDVLEGVRSSRGNLVERLEGLALEDYARSGYHERLDMPMRLVDQCVFQATHDDYHLAIITALKQEMGLM
ncbi:MAG: DinB family protein [Acidimicrobiia bacterium]